MYNFTTTTIFSSTVAIAHFTSMTGKRLAKTTTTSSHAGRMDCKVLDWGGLRWGEWRLLYSYAQGEPT